MMSFIGHLAVIAIIFIIGYIIGWSKAFYYSGYLDNLKPYRGK